MPTALDIRHKSLDDFLAWERQQPEHYERVAGIARMMTGGTAAAHNRITRNMRHGLEAILRLEALGVEIGPNGVFARVGFAAPSGTPTPEASDR